MPLSHRDGGVTKPGSITRVSLAPPRRRTPNQRFPSLRVRRARRCRRSWCPTPLVPCRSERRGTRPQRESRGSGRRSPRPRAASGLRQADDLICLGDGPPSIRTRESEKRIARRDPIPPAIRPRNEPGQVSGSENTESVRDRRGFGCQWIAGAGGWSSCRAGRSSGFQPSLLRLSHLGP